MKNTTAIILAAGEGKRMKSAVPKVLHQVCGKPMLKYMLEAVQQLGIARTIVVLGHKADKIQQLLGTTAKTVKQTKLLGSADAVWQAGSILRGFKGDVLVVYGDTPLVSHQSLKELLQSHQRSRPSCTILTATPKNPTGFGRILRDDSGQIVKIVEEQDANAYQKAVGEINVGAYCFQSERLFAALKEIKPNNAKQEYYLTDAIELLFKQKLRVEGVSTADEDEGLGVNSRSDLAYANAVINSRKIKQLTASGVTVLDPQSTYIYGEVTVGPDSIIYPHTFIEGQVKIGPDCRIGPFARLRNGTVLGDGVAIGNFVEVVRSKIGSNSKIKHHSYIGDAIVGRRVNIGAGAITANYDGKCKNCTIIADNAFIGVGAILIAPVKIGKGAIVGAGSVVTKNKNVPGNTVVAGVPARIIQRKNKSRG